MSDDAPVSEHEATVLVQQAHFDHLLTMRQGDGSKERPEDQVLPTPNRYPHAHDRAVRRLLDRKELGTRRYGVPLQPFNGRDVMRDLAEEVADAAAYVEAATMEYQDLKRRLEYIVQTLDEFLALDVEDRDPGLTLGDIMDIVGREPSVDPF